VAQAPSSGESSEIFQDASRPGWGSRLAEEKGQPEWGARMAEPEVLMTDGLPLGLAPPWLSFC
jgi:hypothetical protein